MKIDVENLGKFRKLANNLRKVNAKDRLNGAIKEVAFLSEGGIKRALTVGPTRAILTGALRSSVHVTKLVPGEARVGPGVKYSIYVHEGTRFMRARPFVPAGVERVKGEISKVMKTTGANIKINMVKGI